MTTDTVLTIDFIADAMQAHDDDLLAFARAIEQAVLQSPEVQRLRDMRSYLWVAADALECICEADRAGLCESIAAEALPTIREAMEKQP